MSEIQARVFQAPGGHQAPPRRTVTHRLLKTRGYCPTGSRYITRANVRDVLQGKTQHAIVRNNGSERYKAQARPIRAHVTRTRLRIGCHVWSGQNFQTLQSWALSS
jgi:hypothetical protein